MKFFIFAQDGSGEVRGGDAQLEPRPIPVPLHHVIFNIVFIKTLPLSKTTYQPPINQSSEGHLLRQLFDSSLRYHARYFPSVEQLYTISCQLNSILRENTLTCLSLIESRRSQNILQVARRNEHQGQFSGSTFAWG